MKCTACQGKSDATIKCFLKAMDTIKEHFLMMQGLCAEKEATISQLNTRNEKLHNALDLLRQGQEQRLKSSPKRRRLSPKKPQIKNNNTQKAQTSPLIPESQSSLNMNIALCSDDDEEEIITETEPPISPYKPWKTRHKSSTRNCENEQPTITTTTTATATASTTDANSPWLGKVPKDRLPMGKTKMSLTIRSDSPRLKQTRLQFDAAKTNNTSSDKDIIDSSPNLYSSLKQAKQSRSLLQSLQSRQQQRLRYQTYRRLRKDTNKQ
ncbi:uncharacterized protein LOC108650841 isoform X2 [Drosophila navojoa]|uniref:uncharacterized protein LOC108650841 isoform X2 n=1 Tax=Drosophila navojoa TaxID=7232 RepID=UPI000847D162|nr:uncharacterized protein LOC108650841 isoform X2 [Drosophila navojoa]